MTLQTELASVGELRAAGLRVIAAFKAMGEANKISDLLRCRTECERSIVALDIALGAREGSA